jgi:O-Antigen ligase
MMIQLLLILLAFVLPFETSVGIPVFGLVFNSVEIVAIAVIGTWVGALIWQRRLPQVPVHLLAPATVFGLVLVVSAFLAPEYGRDALKYALRQIQGMLIAFCIAERIILDGWQFTRMLLAAFVLGAGTSAALGLWELSEAPWVLGLLSIFKTQLSFMGGTLRLSGTFVYANVAAMFYEATLPLTLVATFVFLRGAWRGAGILLTLLLLAATILTYSRTALVVCALLLVLVPLIIWLRLTQCSRNANRQPMLTRPILMTGVPILALAGLLLTPTLRLRLLEPEIADWYGAHYQVARIGNMAPGELREVQVQLTNTGQLTWPKAGVRPVMLAYHWFDPVTGNAVIFDGLRTQLPHDVAPGEQVILQTQLQAPMQAGEFEVAWDLLRENGGGWFSQYQVDPARERVQITGVIPDKPTPVEAPHRTTLAPVTVDELPQPSRTQLWQAALTIWRTHPLLGIGMGSFQQVYGPYLGMQRWDTRIHTNNLYLEVLVGTGIVGLIAFLALIGAQLYTIWQVVRKQAASQEPQWLALTTGLVLASFLIHGILDAFLAFTSTNLLLWMWLGIGGACERLEHVSM